ncbi:unnamed protein product [Hydatigera taeniaeformis]|uniref:Misat_Tub_SegII domain-containing protein n=1 Tax=Hydatigena taeniaeformis TaxID=6205 RepID=A0A0R3X034_HYDTA|nr:unnamed protein product [Hydatigera taeniaeformis]
MDYKDSSICIRNTPSCELVFIQAGPSSNWIGAHFWNLQESILFQGVEDGYFYLPALFRTNTRCPISGLPPRLIAIDTLGSIRSPGLETSITPRSVTVAWGGDVQTIRQDDGNSQPQINGRSLGIKGTDCEIVESDVSKSRFWTDCLLPMVKRKWNGEDTVVVLREYLDSSSPGDVFASPSCSRRPCTSVSGGIGPTSFFSSFSQGLDLYRAGGDAFEDFENHLHRLVEECDHLNGFSLFVDSDSGFAGVGLRLGEFLGEEFAKRPVFTSAISSHFQPPQLSRRWPTVCLNRLALYAAMEEATNWPSCSAWMPVSDAGDVCATSSRLAAGLATLLTPVLLNREHKYSSELHSFINSLTPTRKKMMSLSLTTQETTKIREPSWTHANTFRMCRGAVNVSSRPRSLVCQFFTRGFVMEEDSFLSYLPHCRGSACFLVEGVDPELSCSLPAAPITVPRLIGTGALLCTQPVRSRTRALIEGVSHWTAEDQWLSTGLKLHMDCAFHKSVNPGLEIDELRQLKESVVGRLVEAYASPDG